MRVSALTELKAWDPDATTIDEMVALAHWAKGLREEFERRNVDVPEWLDDKIRTIDRAINYATQDKRELRIKELKAQIAQTRTAAEKRQDLQAELDKLQATGPQSTT